MLIYGYHPVREALRGDPRQVRRVMIGEHRGGARRRKLEELCAAVGVPCEVVAEERLSQLAPGVHNGFVAELAAMPVAAVDAASEGPDEGLVVVAEDVQDPRNLGALLRVCEGAGVGRVLLRDRGSAPLSAAAIKASAGAAEWLAVQRIPNTAAVIDRLKKEGFWVYGAVEKGVPPWDLDLKGRVALCVGGEEKGLRAHSRELCDALVGLPMRGRIESLNLATAAAAILYEAVRQRTAAGAVGPLARAPRSGAASGNEPGDRSD